MYGDAEPLACLTAPIADSMQPASMNSWPATLWFEGRTRSSRSGIYIVSQRLRHRYPGKEADGMNYASQFLRNSRQAFVRLVTCQSQSAASRAVSRCLAMGHSSLSIA